MKNFERTHAEEERLAGLVLKGLSSAFRDKADPYSPEILRGCFELDLNRFKKQSPTLFRIDPNGPGAIKRSVRVYTLGQPWAIS
jgi:hypothetical protein